MRWLASSSAAVVITASAVAAVQASPLGALDCVGSRHCYSVLAPTPTSCEMTCAAALAVAPNACAKSYGRSRCQSPSAGRSAGV